MLWQDDVLAIGGLAGLVFLILLIIKYRWRCHAGLTWPQIFMAAGAGGLAVYHIIWVVWGQGRTGWP